MTQALALPDIKFETTRLGVAHWGAVIGDPIARAGLLAPIRSLLSPEVVKDLPPSFQLEDTEGAVDDWIDAQTTEGEFFLVRRLTDEALVGLLILAPAPGQLEELHLGYLFHEKAWGGGLASELIEGLLSALEPHQPLRILGGVAIGNPASARVLTKHGFQRCADLSDDATDMFVLDVV